MLRSLLTTTALAALLAGGTAVAQTDTTTADTAKPEAGVEGQAATDTQTGAGTGATAEGAAEMSPEADGGDMTAEGDAELDTEVDPDMAAEGDAELDTETQSAARATGFVTEQDGEEVLASKYMGKSVLNSQEESIGTINDLVMDMDGNLTAAVIGVGGFLGIGEKNVGVPIDAIDVRTDPEGDVELVMQSTREELEAAPAFVDLEEQVQAQEAARQEQERQQMNQQMNQTTTAPATGTTN